jgi:hypothetical protein
VLADIDSSGLTEFSDGIGDLYSLIQQLHKRLSRMFVPDDEEDGRTFSAHR